MKPLIYAVFCIGMGGLVTSCVTSSEKLYAWRNYESTSYNYYKKQTPEATANLIKTYEQIINNPSGARNTVPPGTYAEYGYLLLKEGKKEEATKMFKMEMSLYPESTTFMNRLIKQFEK